MGILAVPGLKRPIRAPDIQRAPEVGRAPFSQRGPDDQKVPDVQRVPWLSEGPWKLGGALIVSWPLMSRGPLIFIGPLTVGRPPDIQKDHWWWLWLSLGPLIVTEALFLAGSDGQSGPDCPDVLFCRFLHRFRDFCEVFGCFRWSFGLSGPSARGAPKTPRWHTPSAPWLCPCLVGDVTRPMIPNDRA